MHYFVAHGGHLRKIYFEMTLLARRKWRHKWVEYTLLPVLTAGFMMIAFTEIPPISCSPSPDTSAFCNSTDLFFR